VISLEADDFVRRPFLQIEQELDDPAAIGAAIHVIAEKDELRSLRSRVLLAKVD
jgi:hypothetical protein